MQSRSHIVTLSYKKTAYPLRRMPLMPLGESMSPGTGTGLGMALSTYPNPTDQVKREPHADQCCARTAGLLQRALACVEERSCP